MAKLYVFGIGGTGSRVIKSLAMLLATGVEANGFEIVPIIIDPDEANGDVTRTIDILKNYQHIRNALSFDDTNSNKFFGTRISNVTQNFRLHLSDVKNDRFKDYIEYSSLDDANKALISLLFSEDNLNADMEVGFKGNPNIGSVVLNQFKQSQDFKDFASSFCQDDRIFIISSIFGGTGAAGFPLLLKNIRDADHGISTWRYLQDAPVGAITMLPYFGVSPSEESKIDKSSFISKTKAALSYYEQSVSGNKSLNALYYLGDNITKDYPNHEGSVSQKNDAHFLEIVAALSIVDFAKMPSKELVNVEGKADNPVYKEFGIKENSQSLIFANLGFSTQTTLRKNLTQYQLFTLYLNNRIASNADQNWTKELGMSTFMSQPFYSSHLRNFNQFFTEWLHEMAHNTRSFSPFNLLADDSNLFEMVKGVKPKSGFLEQKNYNRYDYLLSKAQQGNPNTASIAQRFMDLFHDTTQKLVTDKYNF
ncbi:hypothetical protein [Flavobacterium sp.]|uniref:hypothetical protein n=1 Tax=Flavobacterium sp. TaxID=239 RepID=UPI001214D4B0|nr:hypothetical protein [Flavobacterium sp.]RZJ70288.1 MAG: hypothetical protein EOO49_14250 [Flavobacterium sp.]